MITPDLLQSQGIEFVHKGREFSLDCPYCGATKHLYLNENGAFLCHHCQEAGTWAKLKQHFTGSQILEPIEKKSTTPDMSQIENYYKKLLGQQGSPAIEYLYSRKITLDSIHKFKIGLNQKDDKWWLTIPLMEKNSPVNVKYRSLPPAEKEFERWTGGKSVLFNGDLLSKLKPEDQIIIAEGEFDCIILDQLGFNAVGLTGGAGTIIPAWIKQLEKFKRVYLCYDADDAGRKGCKDMARRIGIERAYCINMPCKDVNQWFVEGGTRESFFEILKEAKLFDIDNVCTLQTAFTELIREYDKQDTKNNLVSKWPAVKRLTGSFEPGDLIVVSAKEKTGKTTYCLNEVLEWTKQGHPVLFYCLEMRPSRILRKAFQIILHKKAEDLNPAWMTRGYNEISEWPLYLGYNYKKCHADIIFDTIRLAWKRYGIEAVVFDNLHYLARDIKHQTQEVGQITQTFKMLAEELEIPIILIAQPRKIERDAIMGIEDLKDSSSIGADADQVIVLWRKKTQANEGALEAFEPKMLVRVDASRYKSGGETVLYFEGATGEIREISKYE